MKICAIVVTFNGKCWYDKCFSSLRISRVPLNVVVIDNASSDDSVEYIKRHFPEIHLIESNENLGFAKANNIGIKYALEHDADYVFLLNQDAWIGEDTLSELVKTFEENENVGIASPMHLNGSYSGLDVPFSNYLPRQIVSDAYLGTIKRYYEAPFVNAAAWLVSRYCIQKIGGFDTNVFIHCGEDDNYCQRLRYHKLKLVVNTSAQICHDREQRDPKNDCNRVFWREVIRREELAEMWSNINDEIQMDKVLRRLKCKLLVSQLLFQKSGIIKYKELIEICRKVVISREINQREGLNWLEE